MIRNEMVTVVPRRLVDCWKYKDASHKKIVKLCTVETEDPNTGKSSKGILSSEADSTGNAFIDSIFLKTCDPFTDDSCTLMIANTPAKQCNPEVDDHCMTLNDFMASLV